MKGGREWRVEESCQGDFHVYPLNDSKPHDIKSHACDCRPKVEQYRHPLFIHNSWDGREIAERAIDQAAEAGRN